MENFSPNISFVCRAKGSFPLIDRPHSPLAPCRAHADYYSTIKDPIDLTQIQTKVHQNEYQTFEEFLDDLELLFNNAKNFYRVRLSIDALVSTRVFSGLE